MAETSAHHSGCPCTPCVIHAREQERLHDEEHDRIVKAEVELVAVKIEAHAREYARRTRGITSPSESPETRAYLRGLADAAKIARGGRAQLPEGEP